MRNFLTHIIQDQEVTRVEILIAKFPSDTEGFAKQRPEWEIVGAFASDPISICSIEAGSGGTPTNQVTVTTVTDHGLICRNTN